MDTLPQSCIDEVKIILNEYANIERQTALLLEQTILLNQRKLQIESELTKVRESERALIDKIEKITNKKLDLFQILQSINQ